MTGADCNSLVIVSSSYTPNDPHKLRKPLYAVPVSGSSSLRLGRDSVALRTLRAFIQCWVPSSFIWYSCQTPNEAAYDGLSASAACAFHCIRRRLSLWRRPLVRQVGYGELEGVLKNDVDSVRGNVCIPERREDEQDHRPGFLVSISYRCRAGLRV